MQEPTLCSPDRCITIPGMRTAQEAVHPNFDESRSVYNFVNELCIRLGAESSAIQESGLMPRTPPSAADTLATWSITRYRSTPIVLRVERRIFRRPDPATLGSAEFV